ncbi:MAG: hypothetical protein E6G07_11690 [Actinobacteria bacterium]|nr:MAG: hypothetical protein E6G07_11690 [Actinomycetota bacterium]
MSRESTFGRAHRRLTASAVAIGISAGVSACGGKSDAQQVRDVVNGFDKTLFENKFAQACGYLSDTLVKSAFRTRTRCLAQIETHNPSTEDGTIKSVAVHGNTATVVAQGTTEAPAALELRKQGGAWKITGPLKYFSG